MNKEVEHLRERLTAALEGVAGEMEDSAMEKASGAEGAAVVEQERSDLEGSNEHELLLSQERERASDLEKRLNIEETFSWELREEAKGLRASLQEAEKLGEEAMQAAGTEAARAAELREGFQTAEAELEEMRRRLIEYEEDSVRAAELKGTLEMTRDALDELRYLLFYCIGLAF